MKQFLLTFFVVLGASLAVVGGVIFTIYFLQFLVQHLPIYIIGGLISIVGSITAIIAYHFLSKIEE